MRYAIIEPIRGDLAEDTAMHAGLGEHWARRYCSRHGFGPPSNVVVTLLSRGGWGHPVTATWADGEIQPEPYGLRVEFDVDEVPA